MNIKIDYAKLWSEACAAHEDAATPGQSLHDNIVAGDAAAADFLKTRIEALIKDVTSSET
jgi:hypothetical protein